MSVGKHTIDDRDQYIPGDLNPVFGRMYELNATMPLDNKLTITVMDWDRLTGLIAWFPIDELFLGPI